MESNVGYVIDFKIAYNAADHQSEIKAQKIWLFRIAATKKQQQTQGTRL